MVEEKKEPAHEPPPQETPAPEPSAQILLKVPPSVKERAQLQADLAFKYGWIKSATLTQLFIWTTESFLDSAIKAYIQNRRKAGEGKTD